MSVMEQQAIAEQPLTLADRCDKCGAEAKSRHWFRTGELIFCAHHAREFADAMLLQEISVQPTS